MNKFAVIIPYFGQFKPSIVLFLESCKRNPNIDWLVFSDCDIPEKVRISKNILWHSMVLDEVRTLAENKLGCPVSLNRAYKLCDLKPMYGLIFEDYIRDYLFWGFGDTDVIYGDVFNYLNTICYDQYDKINWMGHLCFMRNTPEMNAIAMKEVPGTISPKQVLKEESNQGYDERDFNRKCLACHTTLYNDKWAADIDIFYWRMRCADLKTFHYLLDTKEIKYAPRNYKSQIFASVDGRIYRIYIKAGKVHKDEFAYIHFRREVPIEFDDISRSTFIISRNGFFPAERASLEQVHSAKEFIKKYNNQEGPIQECKSFLYQFYRKVSGKRGW